MILTAHQPVYLPWLGLFHKMALSDVYVFFDDVQYQVKDWNNRNLIKTPQGPLWLTVPVLSKGYRSKNIREIEINNQEPWQRKHWKTLQVNYGRSPYFDQYAHFFQDVYSQSWRTLVELNEHMLRWFLETLGIHVKFLKASELGFQGSKSELVLDMCRRLRADLYIFGAQGKDYANVDDFLRAGIRVLFQEYRHPVYPQGPGPFLSHLSVVDLLFHCGPESLRILMENQMSKSDVLGIPIKAPQ